MQILESNPVVFVVEFVKAVQQGWKLKDCTEGRPSHAFLHSLNLYKGFSPEVVPQVSEFVHIDEYDSFEFLKQIQNATLNGYELDVKSVNWNTVGKKLARMTNPNYIEVKHYSKKELEDMDWNDLKKTGRMYGHGGRDRNLLINRILESQKEK